MVPEVGIAPTSPRLQRGANLPQLLGEMVVPAGNAPASSGYQPGAGGRVQTPFELRDEFKLRIQPTVVGTRPKWRKASVMLRPRLAPILFSRQVQPAYICLPSINSEFRTQIAEFILHFEICNLHSKWLPDLDSHQGPCGRPPAA
jgi:hypothetical protein